MKLYGNVTRLFQYKVRYVREMDRLPVELIPTGAKINLCVGEDLKKKNGACVERIIEIRWNKSKRKFSFRRLPNFSTISSIYIPHISNDHRKYRNQLEYLDFMINI